MAGREGGREGAIWWFTYGAAYFGMAQLRPYARNWRWCIAEQPSDTRALRPISSIASMHHGTVRTASQPSSAPAERCRYHHASPSPSLSNTPH
jgi:hypothetical protein